MDDAPADRVPVEHESPPSNGVWHVGELEGHEAYVVKDANGKVGQGQVEVGWARAGRADTVEEGSKTAFDRSSVAESLSGVGARPVGIDRVTQVGGEAGPTEAIEGLEEGCGRCRNRGRVPQALSLGVHRRARGTAAKGKRDGEEEIV